MAGMAELRAYKEVEYHLTQRLMEKERLERKAHRGCVESQYQEPYLQQWTDAINASIETKQALVSIQKFIKEIESE